MHRSRIRVPGTAVALIVAVSAVGVASAAMMSPRAIALQKSDVPSGYKLFSGVSVSNAQMAAKTHVALSLFKKHGRVTGFEDEYRGNSLKKATNIFSNVYMYASPAGATWDYTESKAHDATGTTAMRTPSVGEASFGFTKRVKSGKYKIDLFGIDFRRGDYDMTVGVAGSRWDGPYERRGEVRACA